MRCSARKEKFMEKEEIVVSASVNSNKKAKKLLDDLEVLKDKYSLHVSLTIFPQKDFEVLNERT